MKILVAAAFPAGAPYAHAIHTCKMAQGFARLGHDILVACRRPRRAVRRDPAALGAQFGIHEPVAWCQLPWSLGERLRFGWGAAMVASRFRPHMVYARNYAAPCVTSRIGLPTAVETHAHPDNRTRPFLRMIRATRHRNFRCLVTISPYLAAHYGRLGVPPRKLVVLPDAVDLELFRPPAELPPSPYRGGGPHIVYAGHLYDYKGIPTILSAAARVPHVRFHLVGGLAEDVQRQRERMQLLGLTNVVLHGPQPHAAVPPFLWHADALLLVPSARHASARWTSPVKLGEYLASGVPVIASRIAALRRVLDDQIVRFVRPDNPVELAAAVRELVADSAPGRRRARAAARMAEELTYERRAQRILAAAATGSVAPALSAAWI